MRWIFVSIVLALLSTSLYAAKPTADGPLPPAGDYTVLAGRVTIGTIDAHTIAVVVDDGGSFRNLFRLWTEAAVKPFRATSPSASIEFRGDELVVMAADQEWFYALVTNTGDSRAPRPPSGLTATRFVGYGLNHEIRPIAAKLPGNSRHVIALDCQDDFTCVFNEDYGVGGGGGGACDSGGPGSNSCSTSNSHGSCSVECTYGYACCTNATSTGNASCRCKSL